MPSRELACPVGEGALAGQHGQAHPVPPDVVGQLLRRSVAAVRFLPHRHCDDGIEVAGQLAAKARGRRAAPGADGVGPNHGNLAVRRRHGERPDDRGARLDGHVLADIPPGGIGAAARGAKGPPPGQQLVEQDSQREHVRGRRDGPAEQLLGAGVLRRHEPSRVARLRSGIGVGRQHLRDAEVEQLQRAVGGDEDVLRLQIAMDHEVPVRRLHRQSQDLKQLEPFGQRQALLVAVPADRRALHEFHDEERQTFVGRAAVQQPRDVRVVEAGQRLAFVTKAEQDFVGVEAPSHHLERHDLVEGTVGALRKVDGSHPAVADFADDAIGANHRPRSIVGLNGLTRGHGPGGRLDEPSRGVVRVQEGTHFVAGDPIAGAARPQERLALPGRLLQGFGEERLHSGPAFIVHVHAPPRGGDRATLSPAATRVSPWPGRRSAPPPFPPRSGRRSTGTRRFALRWDRGWRAR